MFVVPNIKECKSYILCGLLDACHEHKLIRVLFNAEAVNKRAAVCRHAGNADTRTTSKDSEQVMSGKQTMNFDKECGRLGTCNHCCK